jgi:hypothetical protein
MPTELNPTIRDADAYGEDDGTTTIIEYTKLHTDAGKVIIKVWDIMLEDKLTHSYGYLLTPKTGRTARALLQICDEYNKLIPNYSIFFEEEEDDDGYIIYIEAMAEQSLSLIIPTKSYVVDVIKYIQRTH